MILKEYQEKAIKRLIRESKELLRHRGRKLIFKAPTGSGKTIIVAEFIQRFVQIMKSEQFSFIWIAPRQLHIQSKEKLDLYYENANIIRCSFFEDLEDKRIDENEILFFNWESINRKEGINIYIRENEQEKYLSKVLDNTRDEQRKIILIIDESHFSTDTENAENLKELFNPELTIEVSATPAFIDPDGTVSIDIDDVKAEGMIKKSVILNENFNNFIVNGKIQSEFITNTDELVIEAALKKQQELREYFNKENTRINPLIVIQLPPRIRQEHEDLKNNIIALLNDKYNINTENGKLGIYLAEEHSNIENISKNNDETVVLLFKQGIALGWDCPRAQILVLFREWHSEVFSVQTIGRIMRMPEPDKGHYANDILNHAYVYTNLNNIHLQDDIARDMISIYTSKRKSVYKNIDIPSYHMLRQREKTRLSPSFIKIFLTIAKNNRLKEKLNLNISNLTSNIISDWQIENINLKDKGIDKQGGMVLSNLDEMQVQLYFNKFAADSLSPLYPEDRSVGRIKETIYKFFEKGIFFDKEYSYDEIINLVLSDQNQELFKNIINEAITEYISEVQKRDKEIVETYKWNIPESVRFNENYNRFDYDKSIMNPFFISGNWKTEKAFIEFLEINNNVEWWFKNGDRDAIYFSIPYEFENDKSLFFVDFIVKLKDKSIYLLDTKSGQTLNDSRLKDPGAKMDSLVEYINKFKNKRKIYGGIVTNTDIRNFTGRWLIYFGKGSEIKSTDFSNWKTLEL